MAVTNVSDVYDETLARLKEQYDRSLYGRRPGTTYGDVYQGTTYGDVYQGTTHAGRQAAAKMRKEMEERTGDVTYGDVDKEITSKSCSVCMKKVKPMKRCSRCKNVRYCSVECQKEDWVKQHKEVCTSIRILE